MRALLKMLGASFLVALVFMGILALAAFGALSQDVAIYVALGVFIVGGLAICRFFMPALLHRDREAAEPGAADRGHDDGLRE
jgi:hypothetical protein